MATTFTKIASVSVGSGGSSSITFSSIPSTYTDLVLCLSLRASIDVTNYSMDFNDLSTNQTSRQIYGSGSAAASNSGSSFDVAYGTVNSSVFTSNTFANAQIYIPNYAGSNYKSISVDGVTENNASTAYATLAAGLWSATAAITKIQLYPSGKTGTLVEYSTATLYGVSKT
jgi:hypothetical protein